MQVLPDHYQNWFNENSTYLVSTKFHTFSLSKVYTGIGKNVQRQVGRQISLTSYLSNLENLLNLSNEILNE
jgi:hypothetical protein